MKELAFLDPPRIHHQGEFPRRRLTVLYVNELVTTERTHRCGERCYNGRADEQCGRAGESRQACSACPFRDNQPYRIRTDSSQGGKTRSSISICYRSDEYTVVLMLVADSGKVSNTTLRLAKPASEETLRILAKTMN